MAMIDVSSQSLPGASARPPRRLAGSSTHPPVRGFHSGSPKRFLAWRAQRETLRLLSTVDARRCATSASPTSKRKSMASPKDASAATIPTGGARRARRPSREFNAKTISSWPRPPHSLSQLLAILSRRKAELPLNRD